MGERKTGISEKTVGIHGEAVGIHGEVGEGKKQAGAKCLGD